MCPYIEAGCHRLVQPLRLSHHELSQIAGSAKGRNDYFIELGDRNLIHFLVAVLQSFDHIL